MPQWIKIENGILSNDALRFSNKIPSATGVSMTYEFSYNRQLVSGDMIELKLPNWSNGGSIGTSVFKFEWLFSHC